MTPCQEPAHADPAVAAKMREIHDVIAKAVAAFKPLSRADLTEQVTRMLAERAGAHARRLDYHITWTPEDVLTLVPHDLFTGLILLGIPLDEALPFHARDCREAHLRGGTYRYERRFTFTPDTVAEFITLDFATPAPPCATCGGSGEVETRTGLGPDGPETLPCPACTKAKTP